MSWRFALDAPQASGKQAIPVGSPLIVSGWLIPPPGERVTKLEVWAGNELVARARLRLKRPDVARALPTHPDALWSGFDTEVPLDRQIHQTVALKLIARTPSAGQILGRLAVGVRQRIAELPRRARAFDLDSLLACPICGAAPLETREQEVACAGCRASFERRRGSPIFTAPQDPARCRLLERDCTHPYSNEARAIIRAYPQGVVLDFGAGNPAAEQRYPNVLLPDAVHYPQADVVATLPRLPYRDEVFDAVISQAVLLHIARPWETAAELYRVLKPGGRLHVDTAFMLPLYADHSHYFNMTVPGMREVFRQFREVSSGVKPYQSVSYGLRIQWDLMIEHLRPGKWRERIRQLRAALDQEDIAGELDPFGHESLAAGVFFDGVKPGGEPGAGANDSPPAHTPAERTPRMGRLAG